MYSPLDQFDIIPIFIFNQFGYDLTLFNIFIPQIIIIIIFYILWIFKNDYKIIPYNIQILLEEINNFIKELIINQIGKEGLNYLPIILTIFLLILFLNLLSVIPFGIALTSHLIVTMWLSLSICSGIFILGLYEKNIHFLKIFIPKCPIALLPILIIIEIFSYIIRAFSLSIRLTANILAGHTLVNIISIFVIKTLEQYIIISIIGFLGLLFILILELGVACLQAYVMTILICIYIKDVYNIENH